MIKKIMVMPALNDHIEFIMQAKKEGYKVITCDNNPQNPGHKYSDIFGNISLLDLDQLLEFAREQGVDVVSAFSTDIGAIAAAYISDKLGLSGNSFEVVTTMTDKELFRCFLRDYGFCYPNFQVVKNWSEVNMSKLSYPIIVKPTDRASSKGVRRANNDIELKKCLENAKGYAFSKKVILENYIDSKYMHIHGDAIIQDGKIVSCFFGDQYFGDGELMFSPIATVFPSSVPEKILTIVTNELNKLIGLIGYRNGGINVEARYSNGSCYFVEIAPRLGGNFIPKMISIAYQIDIVKYAFDIVVGRKIQVPKLNCDYRVFQFSLRSSNSGTFKSLHIQENEYFEILERFDNKKKGDIIDVTDGPNSIVAVFILKAMKSNCVENVIKNTSRFFNIILY